MALEPKRDVPRKTYQPQPISSPQPNRNLGPQFQPQPQKSKGPTHRCILPGCPVEGLGYNRQNVLLHEEHIAPLRAQASVNEAMFFQTAHDWMMKSNPYYRREIGVRRGAGTLSPEEHYAEQSRAR